MPTTQKLLTAAAGSAGDDPLYVEDVFSTYIYDGNNTTNAIVNGLDLAGEGGMLWTKRRDGVKDNRIWDTERGRAVALISNTTAANGATSTASEDLISFNSNGFTFGANAHYGQNSTSQNYVSWSFRQAENFFTMVKFTATDSFMTPAHGLGSKPGMVIYKCTTSNTDASDGHWWVWVEGMANNKTVNLDTNEVLTGIGYIGDTSATSSQFYCTSGQTYVAYYFGNDQAVFGADSDESIIKCGTYTGAGADLNINVGFEPQLVLIKSTSNAVNWVMFDTMRGLPVDGNARDLRPNTTEAEADNPAIGVTSTGFLARNGMDGQINANGYTYIYMAIRRPMKTPEAGTEVYQDDTRGGTSPTPPAYIAGFPVDVGIQRTSVSGTSDWRWANRLTGTKFLVSNQNAAQGNDGGFKFDYMDGWSTDTGSYPAYHSWMFKRAPGFMDVLCYTGDGGRRTPALTHNLGVVPELVIVKSRSSTGNWFVLSTSLGQFGFLNNGDGFSTTDIQYAFGDGTNYVAPTSTALQVDSSINGNTQTFVAYLFATVAGVSKVGTYTGTGTTHNIDCGFTGGARFVMIKRADGSTNTGDWYVWDTLRGITAGNDPYLLLNSTAAQVTNTDYIDPLASGFTITSGAPTALNYNNGTFIFLAIA